VCHPASIPHARSGTTKQPDFFRVELFTAMKKIIVGFGFFAAIFLLSCEESTLRDSKVSSSVVAHYKTIGAPIPFETGMRWIELYQQKNSGSGRAQLFGHYEISDTKTLELMASVNELVGVAFHYGIDPWGEKHIIVIPVDNTLRLWTNIPGRIYVDANTGNTINKNTAETWAQAYKNQHPTGIWFHFFGADIFDEIVSLPFFTSIDIQPALNDLLMPQMLLIIWNESFSLGRTSWEGDAGAVYDASNPCPPCNVE
jgi:hypothetical protein